MLFMMLKIIAYTLSFLPVQLTLSHVVTCIGWLQILCLYYDYNLQF